jgi:hypothetical protein
MKKTDAVMETMKALKEFITESLTTLLPAALNQRETVDRHKKLIARANLQL